MINGIQHAFEALVIIVVAAIGIVIIVALTRFLEETYENDNMQEWNGLFSLCKEKDGLGEN